MPNGHYFDLPLALSIINPSSPVPSSPPGSPLEFEVQRLSSLTCANKTKKWSVYALNESVTTDLFNEESRDG